MTDMSVAIRTSLAGVILTYVFLGAGEGKWTVYSNLCTFFLGGNTLERHSYGLEVLCVQSLHEVVYT